MTTLLLVLRIAADLCFYYSFAGFVVSMSGGSAAAQVIAVIPALGYLAYLLLTKRADLSCERQKETFVLFCKIYPVFFVFAVLIGGLSRTCASSLPYALLTVILCVFLMRTLRHEPQVYTNRRYLAFSLIAPAALLCLAWLLHLPVVTGAVMTLLSAVYNKIIVPLLMGLIYAVAMILIPIINALIRIIPTGEESSVETDLSADSLIDETTAGETWAAAALVGTIVKTILILAVIAGICYLLVRLFRRLAGTRTASAAAGESAQEIRQAPRTVSARQAARRTPLHPVSQVRRTYRAWLKLCRKKGLTIPAYWTSSQIADAASGLFPAHGGTNQTAVSDHQDADPASAAGSTRISDAGPAPAAESTLLSDTDRIARLRDIYIRARYDDTAGPQDADAAREILRQLRK